MNVLGAIAKRVSVRNYKTAQISDEMLGKILKAGVFAPVGSAAYDSLHIILTAESNPEEKEVIIKLIMNFLNKEN